ncbi:YafY family protein [Paenibacillus sp. GP183]|uniref:helix-turn-helix transcriptional regulator n=1 Tax=Paenibacillus sp. GP183 TaxID=1882751 RepID=UPI000897E028|nr:YafY family protein [Paenibacillus sp. GP183]SEB54415.1 Predicted DNA-binding transcriptional regulator YafY, contains an HTH and WYL domains [Paenibacillus sp. GP183]
MRADRLLQIMLLLQTRSRMTTRELAERLEVSERTIHRDLEALSAAGVPVYAQRGAAGGWRMMEGYRTDWNGFRKDELLALLAGEPQRHLTDLGFRDAYEAAVLKVLASLSSSQRRDAEYMRQRVYVDTAGWHQSGEEAPWLPVLQEAVWEGRKLRLQYASSGDTALSERVVNPLGLVLMGSLWYLVAVRDEQEPRTYRVSRIKDAAMLEEPVMRPNSFDLAVYWQRSVDRFRSELPFYSAHALVHPSVCARLEQTRYVRVAAWLEGKIVDAVSSGRQSQKHDARSSRTDAFVTWQEAELEFNTLESARDILLGFGDKVCVLEPFELRDDLLNAANNITTMYDFSNKNP